MKIILLEAPSRITAEHHRLLDAMRGYENAQTRAAEAMRDFARAIRETYYRPCVTTDMREMRDRIWDNTYGGIH